MRSEQEIREMAIQTERERDLLLEQLPDVERRWVTSTDMEVAVQARQRSKEMGMEIVWKNAILGTLGYILEDEGIGKQRARHIGDKG